MKLHRFHVAEGNDSGLESNCGGDALRNHGIGRHAIKPSRAASGDGGGLGDIGNQFTGDKISHNRAVTTTAVMD